MSDRTENEVLVEQARNAAGPVILTTADGGDLAVFHTPHGVETLDLGADVYARRSDTPRRKLGTTVVHDVDSFALYYEKHADDATEVYVDLDKGEITAVLNAHETDGPRWGDHRLKLVMTHTEPWKRWTGQNRRYLTQGDFADFIEDNLRDILAEPVPPAAMLEIARTFKAKTSVSFSSGVVAESGDIRLRYEETTTASGGAKADIGVPRAFVVGLQPFEDVDAYKIEARLRHRIQGHALHLCYLLDRPEDVVRAAVKTVVEKVEEATGARIMHGAPAT
ncbi:hypothetical protein GCM10010402_66350 [Actinomadura luteofluorescens]|uniref:DUF2303 family protein n=1 Tax=Actinomadura luteofluorescens TaxID=46163 RepID=UPI0027DB6FFE|nr:DUF2303 family protein [Actinomadura glauciflava]MCR3744193.1 Uncharacterized conserved protein YfdQ, DUF2303 family [Actinomadura glauciflava]